MEKILTQSVMYHDKQLFSIYSSQWTQTICRRHNLFSFFFIFVLQMQHKWNKRAHTLETVSCDRLQNNQKFSASTHKNWKKISVKTTKKKISLTPTFCTYKCTHHVKNESIFKATQYALLLHKRKPIVSELHSNEINSHLKQNNF